MMRRPPRSTRTDTLLPYTTLFRSLAPTTPGLDGDLVMRNLEKAEDIPRDVPQAGIPEWTWETYGEFRDTLTRVPKAINYHGYVGHSARSEEHTSELQSLMRISYAVFCLIKKNNATKNSQIKY